MNNQIGDPLPQGLTPEWGLLFHGLNERESIILQDYFPDWQTRGVPREVLDILTQNRDLGSLDLALYHFTETERHQSILANFPEGFEKPIPAPLTQELIELGHRPEDASYHGYAPGE